VICQVCMIRMLRLHEPCCLQKAFREPTECTLERQQSPAAYQLASLTEGGECWPSTAGAWRPYASPPSTVSQAIKDSRRCAAVAPVHECIEGGRSCRARPNSSPVRFTDNACQVARYGAGPSILCLAWPTAVLCVQLNSVGAPEGAACVHVAFQSQHADCAIRTYLGPLLAKDCQLSLPCKSKDRGRRTL